MVVGGWWVVGGVQTYFSVQLKVQTKLNNLRNISFVPGNKQWLLRILKMLMTILQVSMITVSLCLFLSLCFALVYLVPVIFIFSVNCKSIFPLAIKEESIC